MPRRPTWQSILDDKLDENWVQTRGLPEDMSLLGFTPLTAIHNSLDKKWSRFARDCQYLEVSIFINLLLSLSLLYLSHKSPGPQNRYQSVTIFFNYDYNYSV